MRVRAVSPEAHLRVSVLPSFYFNLLCAYTSFLYHSLPFFFTSLLGLQMSKEATQPSHPKCTEIFPGPHAQARVKTGAPAPLSPMAHTFINIIPIV